jgi:hypothetical protein
LEEQWNKRQDKFIASLNKYNGDIFEAFKELFQLMLEEKKTEDGYNFLKNALLNVTHEIEDVFTRIFDEKQIDTNRLKEITPLINKECLNISGEDEFYHIIQIITSVTFRNLVEKYSRNMSKEEALENFIIEMNLLKKGLYK